jgi:hypothetical protein
MTLADLRARTIGSFLQQCASLFTQSYVHAWPADCKKPPPGNAAEALDPSGPWGRQACGVEIRACSDDEEKGMGVFATRRLAKGTVVGVYWGELLTQRQLKIRHGSNYDSLLGDVDEDELTPSEEEEIRARRKRLGELVPLHDTLGAPVGGENNAGAYVFPLREHEDRAQPHEVVCIDGEDPRRSSWCRYINHAPSWECNLQARCNTERQLIWFYAKADIDPGEELAFHYSDEGLWMIVGKWAILLVAVGCLAAHLLFGVQFNSPLLLTTTIAYVLYELF